MSGLLLNTVTLLGCTGMLQQAGVEEFTKPYRLRLAEAVAESFQGEISHRLSGSAFISEIRRLDSRQREKRIHAAFVSGNYPDFLSYLQPVLVKDSIHGVPIQIRFWVTSDYLSVGSNDDYVRMPMSLSSAWKIASLFDGMIPTRKMVDAIYQSSKVKLVPESMRASRKMASVDYYQKHSQKIDKQLSKLNFSDGFLVSGHKKDLVYSKSLEKFPLKMAIYGWHQLGGKPIQPLSTVHQYRYVDYSHGVRIVSRYVDLSIGNEPFTLARLESVLLDPKLSKLLSYEGPINILDGPQRNVAFYHADKRPIDR